MPPFIPNKSIFPVSEHPALEELQQLFKRWHRAILDNAPQLAERLVFDGFYPHYFSQRKRILMIGQEPRNLAGSIPGDPNNYIDPLHYIDTLYQAIKIDKVVNQTKLNARKFESLLLKLSYSIQHSASDYKSLKKAEELANTFADNSTPMSYSCAFMNLSKVSNNSANSNTDWKTVNQFLEASRSHKNNFLMEQIQILNPHLIICMNPTSGKDNRIDYLGNVSNRRPLDKGNALWDYQLRDHSIPLIDTWHFTSRKSPEIDIHNPIMSAIKQYGL